VLTLGQEFQKLAAVGLVGTKGLAEAEKSITAIATAEKAATKAGLALAATKVFDSAKLTTLEAGSSRLRVFGSALEPLGPFGIAGAAAVVALFGAMEESHKAVEAADNIYKLAKNAHVTTDELQQTQIALRLAGGEADKAAPGLESFSETLGKASAGLPKALRGFQELFGKAFTAQDVKNLADSGHALETVTTAIAGLKSPAQKDAVIAQLGLTDLKPLIEGGTEAWKKYQEEAIASGAIMDKHLVVRGHELNEEIETATGKIKVQLAEAFINIAPILVKLLGMLAKMAEFAEHVAAALSPLEARGTTDLQRELRGFQVRQAGGGLDAALHASSDQSHISRIQAELARRKASGEDNPPALPTGGNDLADLTKPKAGKTDQTDKLTKTAEEDLQRSLKALAEAYKNRTANVEARGQFELDANNAEAAAEQAKLAEDLKNLLKDETIEGKASDILQAKIEQAQANVELARLAKKELIELNTRFAAEARDDETRKELSDAALAQLELALNLATTQAERNRIERQILTLKQQEALHLKARELSNLEATGAITDEEGGRRFAAFLGGQKTERQQQAIAQENPFQKYARSVQDLNTIMENEGVTAARSLSSGLADAIVHAKNLGDVAKNVFAQLVQDMLAAVIEKDVALPLLAVLGLADGGRVSGPGTSRSDSIPAMLSAGEYVVNAAEAGKHAQLLEAINSGKLKHFAAGGPVPSLGVAYTSLQTIAMPRRETSITVVQPFHFHAEGAVLTTELLDHANRYADRQAAQAYAGARRDARKDSAGQQYAGHLNS
jgi:hypothetical protein